MFVEFSKEVEIEIGMDDIRGALSEAFAFAVTEIDDGEDHRLNRADVTDALNAIGQFLNALTTEHIAVLTNMQRRTAADYLERASQRFRTREGRDEL